MSSTDPFGLNGQVLDGQFRVDKFVGEGGFSVVYRGHHVGLDEPIAIKCLKLPIALGSALVESFVKRFRDESRLHYRLSQGSLFIARTLAHGTTMAPATGALVPYMALEWLDGRPLAADLEVRRTYGDKGRSMQQTIDLLDSAVEALAYAHANGVVHRDVNPGNLFLAQTAEGIKLKVLDFGVAKVLSDEALALGPRAQTIGQIRIFSPQYAAPEQFDDRLGPIGPWTDVYAIALIALEVLRDAPAIGGEHLGDFASRALDPLARPTPRNLGIAVADETERVFASAVALKPRARPQDAGELWGALKHAVKLDAEKGSPAYVDRAAPSLVAGAPADAGALAVKPGVTLAFEKVPLPVRASEPAAPPEPLSEMPPETARMPDAPPREEPRSAAVSSHAISSGTQALAAAIGAGPTPAAHFIPSPPVAPLPIESTMRPSLPQDSAMPPTPPATEVKVRTPPPPVPNAFAQSGEVPRLAPLAAPPAHLAPPPPPAAPFGGPMPAAPHAPNAPHVMGPSPYTAPPAAAPPTGSAWARPPSVPPPDRASLPPETVPLPNGGARASFAAPGAQPPGVGPESDDKPTRVGPGALDALSSLYTGPPPVAGPAVAPPAPRPSDTPTVTTKRGSGERAFAVALALLFVVAALAYVAYTRFGLFHF